MFRSLFDSRFFRIFLLLVIPSLAAAQNNLFTTISLNPVASLPLAIASGDFNGDGIADEAVTSSGTNSVSVLMGTGDGNFLPALNYPVGADPVAIAAGDFNHDGHLDLAVVNSNPNTSGAGGSVSILTGRSDGTFVAGPTYAVGFIPTAIGVGDFDGDGNLDLAVVVSNPNASFNPGFVTVLLGSANGSFTAQGNYGVGLAPVSIAVGDFTGDGKLDLAVGSPVNGFSLNPQSEVSILINNGSGGFQAGANFVVGPLQTVPISIAVADFNDDARLDLAVALNNTSNLVICQGNGDGTFSVVNSPAVGGSPVWVVAGDFNGDGKPDLMSANNVDGTVSVLFGNGDETFTNGATYAVGGKPTSLALADLNGDGKLDVAVVNNADSTAQVFLGEGDGTFRSGSYRVGASPTGIASGDFNKDGFPDLAVLNGDATVSVLLGDGHGGFRTLSPLPGCQNASGVSPGQIVSGDFNADGKLDLATACNYPGPAGSFVNFMLGNGNGTFSSGPDFVSNSPNTAILGLTVADLDGDGLPELTYADGLSLIFVNYLGIGGIVYQAAGGPLEGVATGDFNGDGKVDILSVTSNPTAGITVLLGDGHGGIQATPGIALGDRALVADFDSDGLSDFTYQEKTSAGSTALGIKLSNGDGTFRDGSLLACCSIGSNTGDFNGDGISDVVTLAGEGGPGDVFLGQLDGSFVSSGTTLLYDFLSQTVVADFDGNGSQDLAVLGTETGTVSILLNKNSFQPTSTILAESPAHLVAGQPLTLSAAVGSKQGTPTGSVVFKQAGIVQTTQALNTGAAQTTLSAPTALGQYGYTALYTGDGTFSGSLSQRLLVTVSAASTTTTVASSASPSKLGQSVTFTATVHPEFSGTPTGTVQFYADGNPIASSSVSGGQAAFSTAALTMGMHTIEADYSGDSSFTTSLGSAKEKVGDAASTVTVTPSANPAVYGQPITLTATVTDTAGQPPTGIVVFSEAGTVYGSVTLSAGVAQLTLPQLLVGRHTITAQYSGDNSDNPSKANLTETIQGAPSTTAISSSLNPSNYGQAVWFTATITSAAGIPDGTVTFKNGSQALGTVTLTAGQAQLSVTTISAGARTINAIYNGSSVYATSQNSLQQVVVAAPTTVTLTGSPNPASSGQAVTFTATVNCATVVPSGTVTFKDGKTALGTATVVNGQAQFTSSALTTGTHSMTATFKGSADFAGSTSPKLQEIVN